MAFPRSLYERSEVYFTCNISLLDMASVFFFKTWKLFCNLCTSVILDVLFITPSIIYSPWLNYTLSTSYFYSFCSALLKWEAPEHDGGRPITHYIVEQKGKYDLDFVQVYQTSGPECEASIGDLKEGQIYEWRVRAVNKAGPSLPSQPTPRHLCKHRNRE